MSSLFSARAIGTSNMPRVRTSFVRGLVVVLSTPVLLVGTVAAVFLAWIAALLAGFQGPAVLMASVLAMPPIGTYFDLQFSSRVIGAEQVVMVLLVLIPFAAVRALVVSAVVGFSVEVLETGRASVAGLRRGLSAAPLVLMVTMVDVGFLIVGSLVGALLGPGLAQFVEIGTVAAAIYLLGYAPAARVRQGGGLLETLSKSSRAARIPGTSALAMALLYGMPAFFIVRTPVGGFGVNPPPLAWAFILFINLLHVAIMATYAYRWMCIEDEVPEAPAPRSRTRRR